MGNTNFHTIIQMPNIVNSIVKQATGREAVQNIDMDFVTVAQQRKTEETTTDYAGMASFMNNNELPLKVLAKITAVQSGTGDPAPDNVRPITGYTGVKLLHYAVNLLDETTRTNTTQNIRYYHGNMIFLRKGTYTLACEKQVNGMYVNEQGQSGSLFTKFNTTFLTFTTEDDKYLNFNFYTSRPIDQTMKCWLVTGSVKGTYPEKSAKYYTFTFPADPGTVYGGVLNVTTGVLTVNMAEIASYDGETLSGKWISDRDVYADGTTPTTGAQVVYELSSPLTYQLTPTEIDSFIGENNLYADTGDVSVSYTTYYPII